MSRFVGIEKDFVDVFGSISGTLTDEIEMGCPWIGLIIVY